MKKIIIICLSLLSFYAFSKENILIHKRSAIHTCKKLKMKEQALHIFKDSLNELISFQNDQEQAYSIYKHLINSSRESILNEEQSQIVLLAKEIRKLGKMPTPSSQSKDTISKISEDIRIEMDKQETQRHGFLVLNTLGDSSIASQNKLSFASILAATITFHFLNNELKSASVMARLKSHLSLSKKGAPGAWKTRIAINGIFLVSLGLYGWNTYQALGIKNKIQKIYDSFNLLDEMVDQTGKIELKQEEIKNYQALLNRYKRSLRQAGKLTFESNGSYHCTEQHQLF